MFSSYMLCSVAVVTVMMTVIIGSEYAVPDFSCIVSDWVSMVCEWSLSNSSTTYSMFYNLRCDYDLFKCPLPQVSSCTWKDNSFEPMATYCIWLVDVNNHSSSKSQQIETSRKVKPLAVTDLTVANILSKSAGVYWKHDQFKLYRSRHAVLFRILYQSSCDSIAQVVNTSSKQTVIYNLVPYSVYDVTVDSIPVYYNKPRGLWSDPVVVSFTTGEDVPSQLPKVTLGSFHVHAQNANKRNAVRYRITVYWQTLPKCLSGGVITAYTVLYRAVDKETIHRSLNFDSADWSRQDVGSKESSSDLPVPFNSSSNYQIVVHANTSQGFNKSLVATSSIVASRYENYGLADDLMLKVVYQGKDVEISWLRVSGAVGYTLYWCQAKTHRKDSCQSELQWMEFLPGNSSFTGVFVNPLQTLFALSVQFYSDSLGSAVSSGMMWSPCTYSNSSYPAAPVDVQVSDTWLTDTVIQWTAPNCNTTGYIAQYFVESCRLIDDECSEMLWYRVAASSRNVTLVGIKRSASYRLRVYSSSAVGNSSVVEVKFETPRPDSPSWLQLGLAVVGGSIAVIVVAGLLLYKRFNCVICKKIEIKPPPDFRDVQQQLADRRPLDEDIYYGSSWSRPATT